MSEMMSKISIKVREYRSLVCYSKNSQKWCHELIFIVLIRWEYFRKVFYICDLGLILIFFS